MIVSNFFHKGVLNIALSGTGSNFPVFSDIDGGSGIKKSFDRQWHYGRAITITITLEGPHEKMFKKLWLNALVSVVLKWFLQ